MEKSSRIFLTLAAVVSIVLGAALANISFAASTKEIDIRVDDALERPERVAPEDEHGDTKRDQGPYHQTPFGVQHCVLRSLVQMQTRVKRRR